MSFVCFTSFRYSFQNDSLEIDLISSGSVVAIFRHFIHALEHNEYLRPLLNPYFPQQSLLLVTFQMTKLVLTELQPDTPGNIPLELDCGRCYYTLQEVCRIPGQCDRRGCQRPSTARCSKCKTTYCTPECQRQYVHFVVLLRLWCKRDDVYAFLSCLGTGRSISRCAP
jgi:hypothetical protein